MGSVIGSTLITLIAIACPSTTVAQVSGAGEAELVDLGLNSAQQEFAYSLGAGDRISIEVFKLPQYSGEYEVLVDGSLNLPQVGKVSVQGMTLEQAAKAISAKYAEFLRRPLVTVNLITPRPLVIGIAGEVNRPGSYTMSREGSQFPTITRALQTAGGITQAADLRNAQVRRLQGNFQQQVIKVDLWQLLQTGDLSNDITLRDGDTIFIPTASSINPAESPQLAAASFAQTQGQPISIAVLGEVHQPGTHIVTGEGKFPTVTQAIKTAGGIRSLADIRRIQIRRSTKIGQEQTIELDLWKLLQEADLQQNLILQDGDTVFVPTVADVNLAQASQLRTASFAPEEVQPLNIDVVGEVFRPGPYTVTGDATPTVTRAIQEAGGIKPLANVRQIQIRRYTSTSLQKTIEVNLWDLFKLGDGSQDLALQEGDTIIVPTANELDPSEATQIAEASFAPDTIRINVVGEILRPGIIEVPPNTPLNQALLASGGFNNRARKGSVKLIRLNPNGTVVQRQISIDFAENADEQINPPLRNNDIVIVGPSTFANVSDTLDRVLSPLDRILRVFAVPFRVFGLF
ncbi:MAG: sugar transporter [Symploca sp. SIO2E9]|nr:sugar transporter [Symploca sp. SIO2E9]